MANWELAVGCQALAQHAVESSIHLLGAISNAHEAMTLACALMSTKTVRLELMLMSGLGRPIL